MRRVLAALAIAASVAVAVAVPAAADPTGSSGSVGSSGGGPTGAAAVLPADRIPTVQGPVETEPGAATRYAKGRPGLAPQGANLPHCRPTATHPEPVVLVHGSDGSAFANWAALSPQLRDAGYCVYALNYGNASGSDHFGMVDMTAGAGQLAGVVRQVLAQTGATKVDLVGHSQGATVARYYVNRLGGAAYVDKWIGMASPTYGGTFYGLGTLLAALPGGNALISAAISPAVDEQVQGSAFLEALNTGGDTVPGVRYTTIATRYDEMIQPYTNVALHGPGAINLVIQDRCPADMTGHFNMPFDLYAQQMVLNALDPEHPLAPVCRPVPLGTGIASVVFASNS
ncbi:alpha/beta fold hydrolase [Rhodococcus sp. D2-41]|uniref:Alpha/beta fold hydrolase n=1 Tax=Speluncibacter jeojiensis TaxID=2710754 RepID=A0A9X4M310_9ACTN|nr:alpha/beta fold hydrolase [Rhodococcus sp. D2-41]MDG3011249.1 alpha/beta fold hydrolase [Rhodococcus sp. D2-41]MDG3015899.1 alpha/beta fold hydrolase [Corynebacteriales bacterium D3-21]